MSVRAWCLVGVRLAGFGLLAWGLPGLAALLVDLLSGTLFSGWGLLGSTQVALNDTGNVLAVGRVALGCYLFFGGKWVARQVTRGLGAPGMCAACGYDVRGIESGRCPECGAKLLGR
jgi:hypothetical protein